MINPHGGILINRIISQNKIKNVLKYLDNFEILKLSTERINDLKNIANGAYSPIKGFLKEDDFQSVIRSMKLSNGAVWPIPIILDISGEDYKRLKDKNKIVLSDKTGKLIAILREIKTYPYSKKEFAENVFSTLDKNHPGVRDVYNMKEYLIGGDVELFENSTDIFPEYNLSPEDTRKIFSGRGWNKVVAFQTRNVPHRGHEFLQKKALENADGLFIQPVVGKKKLKDFKDEYILSCYEALIDKYYPKNKVILGMLPLKMRYAGPREAVFHAIIRKNYGCSAFIVGRDHAGVGKYYHPLAAQKIFNNFSKDEIGIEILKFSEVVYNKKSKKHCFTGDCPEKCQISFSGTKLRDSLKNKKSLPSYFIRPEVYNILTCSKNSLIDNMYKYKKNNKGFVLWFTGLSQSGKSTIADKVYKILNKNGNKIERLDGDIVRESLTRDLGFSKQDRDENIRRVSFVAGLLSRNGVGVIASFISPYKLQRENLRIKTENFIEIFVNTPLEVCEKRDRKGLYKKARKGEIKNFTGISDPYENPENPEIELKPDNNKVSGCAEVVIDYLKSKKYI